MQIGLGLGINRVQGGGFNPANLFAGGAQGAWYSPSDISTLFQDIAGTIPVTAAGQPVGMMRDKSGLNRHAVATLDARRPTYEVDSSGRPYILGDGVDDCLVVPNFNMSLTDAVCVFAGVRKQSDAAFQVIFDLSADPNSTNGTFLLGSGTLAGDLLRRTWAFGSRGSVIALNGAAIYAAPITSVVTGIGKISTSANTIRVNGAQISQVTSSQGSGNYRNDTFFIMARNDAASRFNGRIYELIIVGAELTLDQISSTEQWVNARTGAY
jgi:hypothetical protein